MPDVAHRAPPAMTDPRAELLGVIDTVRSDTGHRFQALDSRCEIPAKLADAILAAGWTPPAVSAPPKYLAGWAFPGTARKAHWFPHGETTSTCGRWMFFGTERQPDTGPGRDDCVVCRKRVDAAARAAAP